MRNVYLIAGQSNATAAGPAIRAEILARDPSAVIVTVSSAGAPLTWQRQGTDWVQGGDLRDLLVRSAVEAMLAHPGARLQSLVWLQGEADTLDIAPAALYGARFAELLARVDAGLRAALPGVEARNLDFGVLSVALSAQAPAAPGRENWATVMTEQRRLDAGSERISMIEPDVVARAAGIPPQGMFRDLLHYSEAFLRPLAAAVADAVTGARAAEVVERRVIEGSARSEVLLGVGMDTIRGGEGADTIHSGGWDDRVSGGGGNDLITSAAGNNAIWGGGGDDVIRCASGRDTISGGAGRDLIFGGAGDDLIDGGEAADTLFGGHGRDRLSGGAGDDRLIGGAGADTLIGGSGADVFVFAEAAEAGLGRFCDVIMDFEAGLDRIDLRALETEFVGAGAFLGGGRASFRQDAAGGFLFGDQDGDGTVDWMVELRGSGPLTLRDFLL